MYVCICRINLLSGDFGDICHYLLYVKNLNNTLRKPTDVGISNLFLIVKSEQLNSLLKGV